MSLHLTQLVWKTELNLLPSEHHVLLCLAYFANDKNNLLCCPKLSTIAKYCHLSTRQAIRITNQLCKLGIIQKVSYREGQSTTPSNQYIINELALKGELPQLNHELQCDKMSLSMCQDVTCQGDMMSHNKYIDNNFEYKKENIKRKNEKFKMDAHEVIDFLRKKTGRNYQYAETTLKPIIQRLKEGISVQQCKQVIARKQMEWGNKKEMEKFLRPSTLFNKSNFYDKYLPELVTSEDKKKIMEPLDKSV